RHRALRPRSELAATLQERADRVGLVPTLDALVGDALPVLYVLWKVVRRHRPDCDGLVREPSGKIALAGRLETLSRLFPAPSLGEQRRDSRVHLIVLGLVLEDLQITGNGFPHSAPASRLFGVGERRRAVVGLLREHHWRS